MALIKGQPVLTRSPQTCPFPCSSLLMKRIVQQAHFTAVMDDGEWQSIEDDFMWMVVTVSGECGGLWGKKIETRDI